MAKYCGICGARHEKDDVIRCLNCGAFFKTDIPASKYGQNNEFKNNNNINYNSYNNNGNYNNIQQDYWVDNYNPAVNEPIQKNGNVLKRKIMIAAVLLLLTVVIAIGGVIAYQYTGYRGVVSRFENAFGSYEYTKIVDMYSNAVFYNANPDNNYEELDIQAQAKLDRVYDYFDDNVGLDYTIDFEVTDNYLMSDSEYNDFVNELDYPDKEKVIEDARVVEIEVKAEENSSYRSRNIVLTLTKEEGEWRLYSFQEEE